MAKRWSRIFLIGLVGILSASGALLIIRRRAQRRVETVSFTPMTGEADWQGDWELSARGADPSQAGSIASTDRVTIPFNGTGLALHVRRGNYRAYFWVRIDGEPANRLPQTERGAYLVLSSSDYEPETVTIAVASGLDDGFHSAEVVADLGWDQWPLIGWRVERGPDTKVYDHVLAGLAAGAAICVIGAIGSLARWHRSKEAEEWGSDEVEEEDVNYQNVKWPLGSSESALSSLREALRLGDGRRSEPGVGPSGFLAGQSFLSSPVSLLIAVGVFYISPWLPLTLVSGAALAGLIALRLDLGLALVPLSAPFYLHPRPLLGKSFSMTEILILLCLASWGLRRIGARATTRLHLRSLSSSDLAVLFLVLVAAISALFAERRHVALRELRVIILEPALFYLMLRTTRLDGRAIWRIVDGFVAGAAGVALIGLMQYALDVNVITAEQGFRRLRSVYGSPNNAALYLGRALPVLLSVTAFAGAHWRRLVYGLLIFPVALAILLSFSRAAILLGVPISLLVLGVLAGKRWRWIVLGLVTICGIGIIPLLSTPRFAGLLDPGSGTLFFRLQLWRASWEMFGDHPWLGVGPDNFLYQYRGRYILPCAWQEPHLSHAHNVLLTYATRLGIPGLAAGLWLHASFWRCSWARGNDRGLTTASTRDRRALALGLMGSMAYAFAHGLVDASMFFIDLAVAFLLGLALVQWVGRCETNGQEQ